MLPGGQPENHRKQGDDDHATAASVQLSFRGNTQIDRFMFGSEHEMQHQGDYCEQNQRQGDRHLHPVQKAKMDVVLLIHMDKKAVVSIMPVMTQKGF